MFLELRKLHSNGAIRGYQLVAKYLLTPTSYFYFSSLFLSGSAKPLSESFESDISARFAFFNVSSELFDAPFESSFFCAFFLRRSAINTHSHMPLVNNLFNCILSVSFRCRCILTGSTLAQSPICFFLT